MIALAFGRRRMELSVEPARLVTHHEGPPGLSDLPGALREALAKPFDYPPLRRALTPDDHVAVVIDVQHPAVGDLLTPLLDDILAAGVAAESLSLIGAEPGQSDAWIEELPDRLEEVHVEEHDPKERQRLAYLATTRGGRRLYLNRTLVDADQTVLLTLRRYDLALGHAGAEGAIYPALSDEEARREAAGTAVLEAPGETPWPLRQEAVEVAWLLGQPFYVQLIPGASDGIAAVVAGAGEAVHEAQRRLDAAWRVRVPRRADCVVASLSGDPARHTFADLAAAVGAATRVVRPGGRVVVVSEATPALSPDTETLRRAGEPDLAVTELERAGVPMGSAAYTWARGVAHARVSLLSGLPGQTVEDLFATPLDDVAQVQRLVSSGGDCVVLQDAHRAMPVLA